MLSLQNAETVRISKTLSFWLRHRPEDAGLTLDAQGWTDIDALLAALSAHGLPGDIDTLLVVVEGNDKQRFEVTPDLAQIRARQGHSVPVELGLEPQTPPELLYHGTVERFLQTILTKGLTKMGRSHVHLSADIETARKVGARRGAPIVLVVEAAAMHAENHAFFLTANLVWLTDHVSPNYLRRLRA
jgi:putative RNA 2'-phosphotransferase